MTELTLDDLVTTATVTIWDILMDDDDPVVAPVYRMPERDSTAGPKPTLPDNTLITYSRIVVRVGYEFGVHSLTCKEWNEAGLEIVVKETGLSPDTIQRVIIALQQSRPFKYIKHQIYQAKVVPLLRQTAVANCNVRAMWFHEFTAPHRGRIVGRITKLTGVRESGYQDSDGEYEPPFLGQTHRQVLYNVADHSSDFTMRNVMVYPDDAEAV